MNQSSGPSATFTGNFFDNTKGNLVRHQLGHIQPIAIDAAYGDYLFAPNNAGQRLAMVYLPTNTLLSEIPTGPGITAIVARPNTAEGWAVDSINGCVSVIDVINNRIMRTIQVGKEPHGIAMLADGSRAYVTCSASNSVDVIDCASYQVMKTIAIPARAPRGIAIQNGKVWVVPLFSGNDTAAIKTTTGSGGFGNAGSQQVVTPNLAGGSALPDEDLFAIKITSSPTSDVLDPSQTRTGLGTILLNVHARPGTNELWIPNTEALNLTVGAANFVNGKVVSNRITIVDTSSSTSTPTVLDLDTIVTTGTAAQPAAIAFDVPRNRAYVAAFGSDAVIVLSTAVSPPSFIGRHVLTPLTPPMQVAPYTPARCGPRGMVTSANGNELFVFNGIDDSYSRVDLTVTSSTVPTARTLGYDPTPAAIKRGIGHLANASHSGSGQSSCMSCHVDGHLDMITWNLSGFSDPVGTSNPTFEIDDKGPMTTQSLRGLFEAGVLHWRGEQAGLDDFNQDGFAGLLHGTALATSEFDEVKAATFSLVYPANPRESADRTYSGSQATGRDAFRSILAVGGTACASCHQLPLGTNTEVQPLFTSSAAAHSAKVPQLRGVGDKLGPDPAVTVFGASYSSTISTFVDRTRSGWGLTHSGTVGTLPLFVQQFPGIVGANLVNEVAAFVNAFDTGLAPATTYQRTLVPGVHTQQQFDSAQIEIKKQALAGNCDIVVATAAPNGGAMVPVTFAWDHVLQLWQTGFRSAAFTDLQLRQFTFDAGLIVTFLGEPLGAGRRYGIDRDMDDLLDLDEASFTPFQPSDVTNPDSDGDGLPDGYEARFANSNPGLNPRVSNTGWSNATTPQFTSPVTVVYVTSTTAKLEFNTDQPTFADVLAGGFEATTSPRAGGYDYNHAIHVRTLPQNTATVVTVRVKDPHGNTNTQNVTISTSQVPVSDGARVTAITESPSLPAVPTTITVTIGSYLSSTLAANYLVTAFAYCDAQSVSLTPITLSPNPGTTTGAQVASFAVTIPANVLAAPSGTRNLYFGVRDITPPSGGLPYLEAFDVVNFKKITF